MRKARWRRILVGVSTGLMLGSAFLWARSAVAEDKFSIAMSNRRVWIGSSAQSLWIKGAFSLEQSPTAMLRTGGPGDSQAAMIPAFEKTLLSRTVRVPWWLLMLGFSLLPLHAAWRCGRELLFRAPAGARGRRRTWHARSHRRVYATASRR